MLFTTSLRFSLMFQTRVSSGNLNTIKVRGVATPPTLNDEGYPYHLYTDLGGLILSVDGLETLPEV